MKITIESTDQIVEIVGRDNRPAVPARIWVGATESGVRVTCFVTRIAIDVDADPEAHAQFERELQTHKPPTTDHVVWPARLFLD